MRQGGATAGGTHTEEGSKESGGRVEDTRGGAALPRGRHWSQAVWWIQRCSTHTSLLPLKCSPHPNTGRLYPYGRDGCIS
ncbi:hypothetical protein E2C01_061670 [Portunus trituberculatus]|uniref:Uncharacterized protein n=1 Tax=Portunus trituberculatus TaxID=210409 RepID=A0A5B7HBL7_PORTR|nr:hypothetical protein [Portunus trituberculatus]